jgi:hypothetical protein
MAKLNDPIDKYEMFNEWCKSEGILMPKCEYPHFFENNLSGVKVIENIDHREAYLYVPQKMMLSIKKI